MRRIDTVFLAGPDQWFPDAADHLARKAEACERAGFTAVQGRADDLIETEPSEAMAREIYASVLQKLRGADAMIVNLTPWRGPNADPGTAFEAGFASALGKPVFAYLNVSSEDEADYRTRVEAVIGAAPGEDGRWRDMDDAEIEDLALPENVMLWAEARRFYVIVTPDPLHDLHGLELCLEALRLYSV